MIWGHAYLLHRRGPSGSLRVRASMNSGCMPMIAYLSYNLIGMGIVLVCQETLAKDQTKELAGEGDGGSNHSWARFFAVLSSLYLDKK
jgi:hypothetical protein